jgi:SAM-dependent methyltransferase
MTMASYDAAFFDYVNSGATQSARHLLPILSGPLRIGSVLDVGCGRAAWLAVWLSLGAREVLGIDGDYIEREGLLIPGDCFRAHDLRQEFDLGRRFDLVQSLEVAEHLPKSAAAAFVGSLIRHGDLVLFSAAAPGQGGDHHVNEQDYDYWRALFATHGYVALDCVRPQLLHDERIEPWYRYNTLLYAAPGIWSGLPEALRRSRVADDRPIEDLSPQAYRLRKSLVRLLPVPLMTALAKLKERRVARARATTAKCR